MSKEQQIREQENTQETDALRAWVEQKRASLTDPNTGEVRNIFSNGASPDTPINDSPLSTVDRLKLSFGDEKGKADFLTEKYGEVRKNKQGDLVVPDEVGNWRLVDEKDAWQRTKEIISGQRDASELVGLSQEMIGDIADVGKELGITAASIGTAVATGGTSLIAQAAALGGTGAAASLASSAMGKLSGTYSGGIEEAATEAGIEAILNAGGQFIIPGAVVGAKVFKKQIVDKLAKATGALSRGTQGEKEVFSQFLGAMSGVSETNIGRILNRPNQVNKLVQRATRERTDEAAMDFLKGKMVNNMQSIATRTRAALSKQYGDGMAEIAESVADNALFEPAKVVKLALDPLEQSGLIIKNSKTGAMGLNIKGIAANRGESQLASMLHGQPKARSIFKSFISELDSISTQKRAVGKNGFKSFMDTERRLKDALQTAKDSAYDAKISGFAKDLEEIADSYIFNLNAQGRAVLRSSGGDKAVARFNQIKANYSQVAKDAEGLLDIQRAMVKGRKGAEVAERELNAMLSRAGSRAAKKEGVANAIESLSQVDPVLLKLQDNILDGAAAANFTPKIRGSFVQFAPLFAAGGTAAGEAGKAATGIAGIATATSPRALGRVLKTTADLKNLTNFRRLLMTLPAKDRIALINNPQAMSALKQSIIQAPQIQQRAAEQLLQGQQQ